MILKNIEDLSSWMLNRAEKVGSIRKKKKKEENW